MMRPRIVEQYTGNLNEVLDDAMSEIEGRTNADGEIQDLEDILFRWSLECKSIYSELHWSHSDYNITISV